MRFSRYTALTLVAICVMITAVALPAFGQQRERSERNFTDRLVSIFQEANCPLSDSQLVEIKKLEPGDDFRKNLGAILNDDQKKAYREAMRRRESQQPRGNSGNYVRMMTNMLEREGKPLTDEQQKKIQKIEPGPDSRDAINEILTQEQKDILKNAFAGRGPQFFIERIATTLKEAGKPLSEEQQNKLKELEMGPSMREEMAKILTEEQNKILEESRSNRRGQRQQER